MKKSNKHNKLDLLIDALIEAFLKIPNFDLTQHDEVAKKAFNTITFRIAEISSYKELICGHFIPATNKAIYDSRQLFIQSKYKAFLNVQKLDFNETLYDTIRLAYVGLFHKIESFINDTIQMVDMIYKTENSSSDSISQWVKGRYKIDFRDWQQNGIIFNINWVCNCIKHKDGYPVKEPKPLRYRHLPENERIQIKPEEFKQDCELLLKFYPAFLQILMAFGLYRFTLDSFDETDSIEIQEMRKEMIRKMEEKMTGMVEKLEEMRVDPLLGA